MIKHPTPLDILIAILDALEADQKRAIREGDTPLPIRTYSIIRQAITKACAQEATQ